MESDDTSLHAKIHLELQKYIMKMFVDIIYNLEYLALADFPDVFFHNSHWGIFVL